MVKIRLQRHGAKKKPYYIVVAIDSNRKREGAFLERLGTYQPKADKLADKFKFDQEAVQKWIKNGAQCSETVRSLLVQAQKAS